MKAVATLVAIIALLLAAPLAGAALAHPRQVPAADEGAPLVLRLDAFDPRVVTATGPSVLTVTGVLRNTGDERVDGLGIRLQRGLPLRTEDAVRDALEGGAPTDAVVPQFQELGLTARVESLEPGAEVPVRLTVPLRGAPETTLALSAPGVYELLFNVNGVPEGGGRARLAAVRMLLPVLGLPPGADGSAPVTVPADTATPFTLLYPVADRPRRLSTMPGAPPLLTDDTLAESFAPEGRLGGLVAALAGAGPAARAATCVAVDPDLLQTAAAMSGGYQVVGADGALTPGRGAAAAAAWLDAIRAATRGACVLALPFADADLVALTRHGSAPSAAGAIASGQAIASDLLRTPVLPDTAWPADGVVDEPTLGTLTGAGVRSVILSTDGVDRRSGADPAGVVPLGAAPSARAVLTDPLLTLSAGGMLAEDAVVSGAGAAADPTAARGALATQDALGAIAFRATEDPPSQAPLVLAPPHRWDAGGAAATALLGGVERFVAAGLLTPRALPDVVAAGPPPEADDVALEYPAAAGAREVPGSIVASVESVLDDAADLRSSVVEDGQGVDSDEVFDPLLLGALRPASAAWRGQPALAAASAAATMRRIADVRASVTVLEPPSPFSLGTSDSPLLLTVANGLPVTMRVRVELASTSGLRVAPIPPVEIPPLGRRQIQANAEVLRSGVFTVDAAVLTLDGGLLGPPSRLQVRSTAYGTITLWLTGTAGMLLVVLAGRRILRRVRAEPGRHTDGRPRTGAPETVPDRAPTDEETPRTPNRESRRPHDRAGTTPATPNPGPGRTTPSPAPNRPGPRTGQSPPAPSGQAPTGGPAIPTPPSPAGGAPHPPAVRHPPPDGRPPAARRLPARPQPTGDPTRRTAPYRPPYHPPEPPPGRPPGSR